jgi:peptidoglycan/xylan/chitin deacetylase (PgdA/CDA1 family)
LTGRSIRTFFAIFLIAACAHLSCAAGQNDAKKQVKTSVSGPAQGCKPVYLTIDTGHMEVAPLMAEILNKHQVKVTFFAANERTKTGDGSLGAYWAPWWKARAAEGHEFASHTFDHMYWRADVAAAGGAPLQFSMRATAGPRAGQDLTLSAEQYCEEIGQASARLQQITGKAPLPLFRAPGGKTSAQLLASAKACGYAHVGWSPAGFLGDELASDKFPNALLLKKALQNIRSGDILLAHLGIWSRQDPWAPAVLEPLITGLQSRGFCFQTLREHPDYRAWIQGVSPLPVGVQPAAAAK